MVTPTLALPCVPGAAAAAAAAVVIAALRALAMVAGRDERGADRADGGALPGGGRADAAGGGPALLRHGGRAGQQVEEGERPGLHAALPGAPARARMHACMLLTPPSAARLTGCADGLHRARARAAGDAQGVRAAAAVVVVVVVAVVVVDVVVVDVDGRLRPAAAAAGRCAGGLVHRRGGVLHAQGVRRGCGRRVVAGGAGGGGGGTQAQARRGGRRGDAPLGRHAVLLQLHALPGAAQAPARAARGARRLSGRCRRSDDDDDMRGVHDQRHRRGGPRPRRALACVHASRAPARQQQASPVPVRLGARGPPSG
eukprot:scaffold94_cov340-Prasinococcus_capsulatus_cf.AAC.20